MKSLGKTSLSGTNSIASQRRNNMRPGCSDWLWLALIKGSNGLKCVSQMHLYLITLRWSVTIRGKRTVIFCNTTYTTVTFWSSLSQIWCSHKLWSTGSKELELFSGCLIHLSNVSLLLTHIVLWWFPAWSVAVLQIWNSEPQSLSRKYH